MLHPQLPECNGPTNEEALECGGHISPTNQAKLPQTTLLSMACMLGPNGKCVGMLTPERIHILHNAYQTTKTRGGHTGIQPPPAGFEAEVVALLQRQSSRTIDSSVSQQV